MTRYVLRRLALGLVQVLVVAVVIFLLTAWLPGDAATVLAGDNPNQQAIDAIRRQLGLDRPLLERLGQWLADLARGDLGRSLLSGRPVGSLLVERLPVSALLAVCSLVMVVSLAIGLSVAAANREGSRFDRALTSVLLAVYSVPEFVIVVLWVAVLAGLLGLLPPTAVGLGGPFTHPVLLVLPVLALAVRPVCSHTRIMRAALLEALRSDYVAHARRVGLAEWRVQLTHAMPNALAPSVQHLARVAEALLAGTLVVESIYGLNGLGSLLAEAVARRDLPLIQGTVTLAAAVTILLNLGADLVARHLSPTAVGGR